MSKNQNPSGPQNDPLYVFTVLLGVPGGNIGLMWREAGYLSDLLKHGVTPDQLLDRVIDDLCAATLKAEDGRLVVTEKRPSMEMTSIIGEGAYEPCLYALDSTGTKAKVPVEPNVQHQRYEGQTIGRFVPCLEPYDFRSKLESYVEAIESGSPQYEQLLRLASSTEIAMEPRYLCVDQVNMGARTIREDDL